MKSFFILLVAVAVMVAAMVPTTQAAQGGCMGCTIVVSFLEQIAIANPGITIDKSVSLWCRALASDQDWLFNLCNNALANMAPAIQADYAKGLTPDQTCAGIGACEGDDLKCSLWPKKTERMTPLSVPTELNEFAEFFLERNSIFSFVVDSLTNWSEAGAIKPSLENYESIVQHKPASPMEELDAKWYLRAWVDSDRDGFSTFPRLRGYNWRGQDCNDLDPNIYPGRKTNAKGDKVDHNCNGIYGINPATKKSYESELCNVKQFNIATLGDSATAHFSLPPCWLSGECASRPGAYAELFNVVMDEVDFPHCSVVTGYKANGTVQCPSLYTSITQFESIYNYARTQNPCIHRSYQNIGVNGARSTNMAPGPNKDGVIMSFTPDQENDAPYAVFFSLIGNDVCSKSPDPADMTQPDDFRAATMESLEYLDSVLPSGSYVWLSSLVKGSALFDAMGHLTHPIGLKYGQFYDYLSCQNKSPCSAWLNTNESVRKAADAHAMKLNAVAREITETAKFKNFTLRFNDIFNTIDTIFHEITAAGFPPSSLVEATDGFHPSSTLNSLLAKRVIDQISLSGEKQGAEIFTKNPNADKIYKLFGAELNGY